MADHQYKVRGKWVTDKGRTVAMRQAGGKEVLDIGTPVDGKVIMAPAEWQSLGSGIVIPPPDPGLPKPSPDWTTVTNPGEMLIDDQYMKWEIRADRRIYRNDVLVVPSNDVDELKISDARKVWQGNEYGWWMWLGTGWGPTTTDPQVTQPKPPDAPPTDTTPDPKLTHAEYFDGPGALTRPEAYIQHAQSGTGGFYDRQNVTVRDGFARISCSGNGSNGNLQFPGMAQTLGRWLIRWRLEHPSNGGMCFLLWPKGNNWPIDGEIDLMENFSKPTFHVTNHWGADNKSQYSSPIALNLMRLIETELIWERNRIVVNVGYAGETRNKVYEQSGTAGYEIPDGPMFPAFQSDGPATWIPASGPNALLVDSVEVYSL